MQGLGLGEDLYCQNIPGSINNMIKDWVNFLPSEIDSFIFLFMILYSHLKPKKS